jgi:hypothetical protein
MEPPMHTGVCRYRALVDRVAALAVIELRRVAVRHENVAMEATMRDILVIVFLACLGLAGCGGSETQERTTVVTPPPAQAQPGSTIVVPPGTTTKVCPPGYATC